MTLLDLIRDLHDKGKPVLDYDLFVCDNSALDMEDVVCMIPEYAVSEMLRSPGVPPQYIELGSAPRYLYAESDSDFRKLTKPQLASKLPKLFPRLLVGVFTDRTEGFFPRYTGKLWSEIPPVELRWFSQDDLLLPALDAAGCLTGAVYDNMVDLAEDATFYTVRSIYGSDFAWMGDIARDPLPEGLHLVTK